MADIIESTYEITEQLGSGGGGTVYLARHRRLNKEVVLKIDKRKITTKPEILRREVDVLKNLRHAYIPQVYDFFAENDRIVTVMDYIGGESLDRPLKRGEVFPQAQVIKWAEQLLEALEYLHSPIHGDPPKGYVHSDIKPANIMRLPNNDICLIDFNISLAIGEYNFIGRSLGYASPEHYGIDYSGKYYSDPAQSNGDVIKSTVSDETATATATAVEEITETMTASEAEVTETVGTAPPSTGGSTTGSGKRILPDVRSDIYSLGATLYHLLGGKRPDKEAKNVVPLSDKEFADKKISKPVADIISKAMEPNPDLRFQTASEMLEAFESLRKNDPRTKRLNRGKIISAAVCGILLAAGLFTAFVGLKRIQNTDSALKNAEYSQNALENGDVLGAVDYALKALPAKNAVFNPAYLAEPQKALTSALGVYDLSDSYKNTAVVKLPSAPLFVRLSEDGKTGACMCSKKLMIFSADDGSILSELDTDSSALCEVEFIDNDTLIYAGADGITCYGISEKAAKWTGEPATAIAISGDGKTAVGIYRDNNYAVVYDTADGSEKDRLEFGDKHQFVEVNDSYANPENNMLEIDRGGKNVAVSFSDGSVNLFELDSGTHKSYEIFGEPGYGSFSGAFSDGYFAMTASAAGKDSVFVQFDLETGEAVRSASTTSGTYQVKTNGKDILLYNKQNKILGKVPSDLAEDKTSTVYSSNDSVSTFAVSDDHVIITGKDRVIFNNMNGEEINSVSESKYNRICDISAGTAVYGNSDEPQLKIYRYDTRAENAAADYVPDFAHSETRISADKKYIMQFMYTHFRILDMQGNVINETDIPDADTVFDQRYIREDGKSYLKVVYYDGKTVCYDGSDGSVFAEEVTDKPSKEIISDFSTDNYNIVSPLHGNAEVYDKKTGRKVKEIVKDGSMTYVYQAGDYVIIQYMRDDGYYYAHLTDSKLDTVAELPYFTDYLDGEMYFDYPSGNVRRSEIIGIDELIQKAKAL